MDVAKGIISTAFIVLNTLVCASAIIIVSLIRWLVPFFPVKLFLGNVINRFNDIWVSANNLVLLKLLKICDIRETWNTQGELTKKRWYLVVCNHQSWADILLLQAVLMKHIPTLKFFTKRELLWIPFFGTAMWLLDYPYVYRYNRKQLEQDPSLQNIDRFTIQNACRKFLQRPTSILNFLEGTRRTDEKHRAQNSTYQHLLLPKSGGIGYVCEELGDRIHRLLDVTIVYPGEPPSFWDYLCGRAESVLIDIQVQPLPKEFLSGNFSHNPENQNALKQRVNQMWQQKDQTISRLKAQVGQPE